MTDDHPAPGTPDRRFALAVCALLLVQLGLQVSVLPHAAGRFANVEETWRAFVAADLLAGAPDPVSLYIYGEYEAGSLAVSLLLVPAFAVLGPTWLAVKLVALAWSAAQLLAFVLVARLLFGPAVALLAGALLALGPPGLTLRQTQLLGDTFEAQLLIALVWIALWRLRATPTRGRAAAFGLAAGAALAFSLATLPALAVAALAFPLRRLRQARADLPAVALGLVLGLAPVLYNFAAHGVMFLDWRDRPLTAMADAGQLATLGQTLGLVVGERMADALAFDRTTPLATHESALVDLHRLHCLAVLAAWLAAVVTARSRWRDGDLPPELVVLTLVGAYVAAFLLSPARQSYWLFLIVPYNAMLLGHAAVACWPRRRAPAVLLLACAAAMPLLAWTGVPSADGPGPVYAAPQADPARWRGLLITRSARLTDAVARGETPRLTLDVAWGAGHHLAGTDIGPLAAVQDEDVARALARGWGYGQAWGRDDDDLRALDAIPDGPLRLDMHRGYGRCLGEVGVPVLWRSDDELLDGLDADRRHAVFLGYGYGRGMRFWHLPAAHDLSWVRARDWESVRAGLLARLRDHFPTAADRAALLPRRRALPRSPVPVPDAVLPISAAELASRGALEATTTVPRPGGHGVWVEAGSATVAPLTVRLGDTTLRASLMTGRPTTTGWIRLGRAQLPAGPLTIRLTGHPDMAVHTLRLVHGDPD